MKTLLSALALILSPMAQSETIFVMANNGGGQIELHDTDTPPQVSAAIPVCDGRFIAKSWGRGINDLWGCWGIRPDAGTVVIRWFVDGGFDDRTYPVRGFAKTPVFDAKYGRAK